MAEFWQFGTYEDEKNIEVILCGNPKQNYFKRVFFRVLRRKTLKRMQTNQYEEIE